MHASTKIALALIGSEVALAGTIMLGGSHMTGVAYADSCYDAAWSPIECPDGEVLAENLHRPDLLPICAYEDCSDQPGQIGLWLDSDTGNWYLSLGESSLLVIDDTE